jgi:hypothetical protein
LATLATPAVVSLVQKTATPSTAMSKGNGWPVASCSTGPPGGGTGVLLDVWGSASDDVWAVGDTGQILHWDGSAWTRVVAGGSVSDWLDAVWSSGPDDAWAAGRWGTLLHWDGTAWSAVPAVLPLGAGVALWGSAANDVWLAGGGGSVYHFDGSTWTPEDTGARNSFEGIWGMPGGDMIVVGSGGAILRHRP